ncbi:RNA polymerase subunit sigma-70 [Streptomyces sp. NPDC046862]|uniref:RNA polymerase subunit sigma-70 n=1 Tax=Streptomyces sp. NPDC046862 TaxID=3154603 RepID=UPI003457077D
MTQSSGVSSTQAVEPSTEDQPSLGAPDPAARVVEWYELTPIEAAEPVPPSGPLTPAQAFDALYAFCAPTLVRQTYMLTGRRALARESVEHAFQLAWQRWPEVAVDRDPMGWVRAAAHEYALAPWHRLRPGLWRTDTWRTPVLSASHDETAHDETSTARTDRALIHVLLKLPPPYRRAVLLYDGLGLDLPDTAAEIEASTPATAGRLQYAREAVAARLPELADTEELRRRLADAANGEGPWVVRPCSPAATRLRGERRARRWVHAAAAFTALLFTTSALAVGTTPDHYEAPVAPGAPVRGVPPRGAMGPLSQAQLELRARLRSTAAGGPERLVPENR